MIPNRSPWIHQLNKDREPVSLGRDIETDVVVVGGGIAGICTSFFILRNTDKKVVLVEGGKLGHGATGHNAGQITSYLARSLHNLEAEFGLEMAIQAQKDIEERAWELLDIMYTESKLDIPLSRFIGHLGLSNKAHLISTLKDNEVRRRGGLIPKEILVRADANFLSEIAEYEGLYRLAPIEEILERLETDNGDFVACLSEQKGCTNSALFTEEVAVHLLRAFPERFSAFEHTHIQKVVLHDDHAILDAGRHTLKSERVVLCTNGFDSITIFNKSGLDIDTRFHHAIEGVVGYMSGYLDSKMKPPTAISYITDSEASLDAPYIYLTRRAYEYNNNKHNLISIGGPEKQLEDRREYERDEEYPDWAKDEIDRFVKKYYEEDGGANIDYIFTWHGLMGYTPNKLRLVGEEPKNKVLLYNLGCNGVGILPSVFGGERIAKLVWGEDVAPSIFDPYRERSI